MLVTVERTFEEVLSATRDDSKMWGATCIITLDLETDGGFMVTGIQTTEYFVSGDDGSVLEQYDARYFSNGRVVQWLNDRLHKLVDDQHDSIADEAFWKVERTFEEVWADRKWERMKEAYYMRVHKR